MQSLPNSFFQPEPFIFYSTGPPTQDFPGSAHGPGHQRQYQRCGRPSNCNGDHSDHGFSFAFLKPLAIGILSFFALSMLARFVLFLVAILLSPPVLLLCLFVLVMSQRWEQKQASFRLNDYWDPWEVQRCFRNPRRFRRFFSTSNATRCSRGSNNNQPNSQRGSGSNDRSSPNVNQSTGTPAAPTAAVPSPGQATPSTQDTPVTRDFELISPLNLILTAVATAENANNTENNGSEGTNAQNSYSTDATPEKAPSSYAQSQHQKVPVHRNETDESLTIAMDISGFDVANIRITVENETLCIRGERTNKIGDTFVVEECFDLDKELFDVNSVHAKASDGVLEVKVQKKAASQPRVISIRTGDKKD